MDILLRKDKDEVEYLKKTYQDDSLNSGYLSDDEINELGDDQLFNKHSQTRDKIHQFSDQRTYDQIITLRKLLQSSVEATHNTLDINPVDLDCLIDNAQKVSTYLDNHTVKHTDTVRLTNQSDLLGRNDKIPGAKKLKLV